MSWDIGADYPGLNVDDLQVAVTVAPVNPAKVDALDVYMVIDLSSGPNSPRYPVYYTLTPPVLVPTNDLVACAADPNQQWRRMVQGQAFTLLRLYFRVDPEAVESGDGFVAERLVE